MQLAKPGHTETGFPALIRLLTYSYLAPLRTWGILEAMGGLFYLPVNPLAEFTRVSAWPYSLVAVAGFDTDFYEIRFSTITCSVGSICSFLRVSPVCILHQRVHPRRTAIFSKIVFIGSSSNEPLHI